MILVADRNERRSFSFLAHVAHQVRERRGGAGASHLPASPRFRRSSGPFVAVPRSWLERACFDLSAEDLLALLVPLAQRGPLRVVG